MKKLDIVAFFANYFAANSSDKISYKNCRQESYQHIILEKYRARYRAVCQIPL